MTASSPPSPKRPPESRTLLWLRRINGQYATVLQWAGFAGLVVGAVLGDPLVMSGFGGLIPISLAVGKDK